MVVPPRGRPGPYKGWIMCAKNPLVSPSHLLHLEERWGKTMCKNVFRADKTPLHVGLQPRSIWSSFGPSQPVNQNPLLELPVNGLTQNPLTKGAKVCMRTLHIYRLFCLLCLKSRSTSLMTNYFEMLPAVPVLLVVFKQIVVTNVKVMYFVQKNSTCETHR